MQQEYGHKPEIRARFHLRDGQTLLLEPFAYQSQRSLSNPVDQASLTFYGTGRAVVPGSDIEIPFEDIFQLYDLCEVSMLDHNGRRWVDVVGLVVDCQTQITEQQGQPINRTTVQLVGLGEALKNYGVWWFDPSDPVRSNLGGMGFRQRTNGKIPKGRPDEILKEIYTTWLNDEYEFTLADGTPLSKALVLDFDEIKGSLSLVGNRVAAEQGDLWSTLYKYAETPWQELFLYPAQDYDSKQVKVILRYRPTPFDFQRWDQLKVTEGWGFDYVDEERFGNEQISFSPEVYNFFWTTAKGYWSKAKQSKGAHVHANHRLPIIDGESVRRLGARRLENGTDYIQFLTKDDHLRGQLAADKKLAAKAQLDNLYKMLSLRSIQMHRWFGWDRFKQGAITTRGRIGETREHGSQIGSVLVRQRDRKEFYVTAIVQSWSHPGPWTTTWQVTRGHNVAEYREWWQRSQVAQEVKALTPDVFGAFNP